MNKMKVSLNILFIFLPLIATAQKLPNVQKESVFAPPDVKIDGKVAEWRGKFEAYNKTIPLYYTVANDDNNLYVILHSENSIITSKILTGGVKLSFNLIGKKNKDGVTITFPVVGRQDVADLYKQMPAGVADAKGSNLKNGNSQARETEIANANSKGINSYKTIKVDGLKAIDTLLSIYNEEGIKVSLKIDEMRSLNYEFAIPLKYLSLNEGQAKIFYNIKVLAKVPPPGFEVPVIKTQNGGPPLGAGGVDLRSISSDTDFWGEYTLVKKN